MVRLKIPAGPQELTADWLTQALRQTGTIKEASVTGFQAQTIAEGVGLIGQLARLNLQYDRPEAGAPATLIAKFPAASPENREIGDLFRFYEREIRFYEEIADEVEMRTPRRYYSAMDLEAGEYVLLLEDLAPARVGDQLVCPTPEQVGLATRELAKLHAAWWQNPRLAQLDWMPYVNDPINKSAQDSYQQSWQPFLEKFGRRLKPWAVKVGEKLGENICYLLDQFALPPHTIIHGDYRLDNLFFGGPDDEDSLAVIDWQITTRGRGTFDIAYFMATNVDPPIRKATEMDVLKTYHRTLQERGAGDYSFDELMHDYRAASLFCLVYAVISGGTLDLSNERGVALVTAMAERTLSATRDLDAGQVLPG